MSSRLPGPRGPLSECVLTALAGDGPPPAVAHPTLLAASQAPDPLADGDLQLALAVCYELHYGGFEGVDDGWEWDPDLLAVRRVLEQPMERWLGDLDVSQFEHLPVPSALRAVVDADREPSLSAHLMRLGTTGQMRDYVVQRSLYQLREADPHTWALPRLCGRAKVALAEIQADEYGGGRPERLHATLYADAMRALGLEPTLDRAWAEALPEMIAVLNLMSLLGLHRRWRGAAAGHLAAYEMTSTQPCRRVGNGMRRLQLGPQVTGYWDEHMEADAVHEQVAAHDLCGALAEDEPRLRRQVLVGAAACLAVEARFSAALLRRWEGAAGLRGWESDQVEGAA
jgi:hypothetical protein